MRVKCETTDGECGPSLPHVPILETVELQKGVPQFATRTWCTTESWKHTRKDRQTNQELHHTTPDAGSHQQNHQLPSKDFDNSRSTTERSGAQARQIWVTRAMPDVNFEHAWRFGRNDTSNALMISWHHRFEPLMKHASNVPFLCSTPVRHVRARTTIWRHARASITVVGLQRSRHHDVRQSIVQPVNTESGLSLCSLTLWRQTI